MSQDLSKAKKGTGSVFPEKAYDAAGPVSRLEPIIGPEEFKRRFFFGVPLASPITKEKLSDDDIKDFIKRAINQLELDTHLDVGMVVRRHRLPFDPNLYQQFIHCEIPNKPIQKVIRLAICSANYDDTPDATGQYPSGGQIYVIPPQWVEMGNAVRGTINVNPLSPAFSAIGAQASGVAAGGTILAFIGVQGWVPAFWTLECTHGFITEEGLAPVILNECIGQKAAMMLITNLLPLFAVVSSSLSLDGLGQSVSNQTYQVLQIKMQMLEKEYIANCRKLRMLTGNQILVGNV
jgi:hypothetical protein